MALQAKDKLNETKESMPETKTEELSDFATLKQEKPVLEQTPESGKEKEAVGQEAPVEKMPVTESGEGKGQEAAPQASVPGPMPSALGPEPKEIRSWVKKLKTQTREEQIKTLNDLAVQRGVDFVIEIAKALDDAHVLDELHDSLVDELYQKLVEQGKLKSF